MTGRSAVSQGARFLSFAHRAFPGIAAVLLAGVLARADYVFMNDGQTLRGRVQREGEVINDPFGGPIASPRLGGFWIIDDGVRRIVISHRNVAEARREPPDRKDGEDVYRFRPALQLVPTSPNPKYIRFAKEGVWQTNGERPVELVTAQGTRATEQCVTELTPRRFEAAARRMQWRANYLASEIDPSIATAIVRTAAAKKGEKPIDQAIAALRFCLQAGWLEHVETLIVEFDKEFPKDKQKIDELRKNWQRLSANQRLDEVDMAVKAGAHARAEQILARFNGEGAEPDVLNSINAHRHRYKERNANLQAVRKLFESVRQQAKRLDALPALKDGLAEVERDLNLDTLPRLDAFLSLARQEERNRARGRPAELGPEELLALAVSGWLLGNAGAEAEVGLATRLWQTRQLLRKYLASPPGRERDQLLAEYSKGEALPVDVITILLELLPPTDAVTPAANGPVEFNTRPEQPERGVSYRLQLPPEYHPHRAYPLLVVLPNVRQESKEALERWSSHAAQNGYILASPQWCDFITTDYQFTDAEQKTVLDTIRDIKRRFSVDSERVFLFGMEVSGMLAYDVGMCYPDRFAGVAVMCGRPGKYVIQQKNNVQYLPLYVVDGDKDSANATDARNAFEHWIQRGFPAMNVEWTGRGIEFFHAELPYIFDWMARKRRAPGLPELGMATAGSEFTSTRPGSNRFYWISSNQFATPAKFSARIAGGNQIVAQVSSNVRQFTVWLNSGMVDFEQPVEVRVNPQAVAGKSVKKRFEPSLNVLLEDYYERRDKKSLFVARADFEWK